MSHLSTCAVCGPQHLQLVHVCFPQCLHFINAQMSAHHYFDCNADYNAKVDGQNSIWLLEIRRGMLGSVSQPLNYIIGDPLPLPTHTIPPHRPAVNFKREHCMVTMCINPRFYLAILWGVFHSDFPAVSGGEAGTGCPATGVGIPIQQQWSAQRHTPGWHVSHWDHSQQGWRCQRSENRPSGRGQCKLCIHTEWWQSQERKMHITTNCVRNTRCAQEQTVFFCGVFVVAYSTLSPLINRYICWIFFNFMKLFCK